MNLFNETRFVKARKQHRCEWCGEAIQLGEKHPQFVGKWDGEFQSWRMHYECHEDALPDMADGFMPYEHDRPKGEDLG